MHPILFEWGPIRIGSYGVLLALAFGSAILITNREFRRNALDTVLAWDIYLLAIVGGLVGSRLLYIVENFADFLRNPVPYLFSATGFSVIGGYVLAISLCWIRIRREDQPFLKIADLCSPGLAVGYAVGRLGCIAAGDGCYGIPTLSWCGMTFPHGLVPTLAAQNQLLVKRFMERFPGQPVPVDIPVHPTPLYESLSAFALLAVLLAFRWRIGPGRRFAAFLAWFGAARFAVEFIRLNPAMWGGFTSGQLGSIGLMALSLLVLAVGDTTSPSPAPEAVTTGPGGPADPGAGPAGPTALPVAGPGTISPDLSPDHGEVPPPTPAAPGQPPGNPPPGTGTADSPRQPPPARPTP
ncbi:MAG: hypothetical protein GX442_22400 [Candidatus Riflebacteria bacterium]|nr:hypothetical protein [Candidatus Riflebacteria bacterium]